ncbi:MAG: hypothetical protein HZC55_15430 [Verrucomicrobia bacterium]|nr:hypothetical protein [Verrucomicrobiota bacterium]
MLLVLVSGSLHADIYTVRREGAGIVPERSTNVSMDSENVVIGWGQHSFEVIATFVMRNQSEYEVTSLVAFPIIGSGYAGYLDISREFKVDMKSGTGDQNPFMRANVQRRAGAKTTARTDYFAADPPKNVADYPEAVVWEVTWAAGETKVIRVRFEMGDPMVLRGSNQLVRGWQLMYIVSTGALWKGPIGRADISIRLPNENPLWAPGPGTIRKWSYADQAKWDGQDTIAWHFENWTPSDEIWLRSVEWAGLSPQAIDYFLFFLPPYEGDKKAYSVELIDSLVRRDLALADQYFPEKVKAFDATPLKVAICDWLLHEVYARHGDPFYVGKESASLKVSDGLIGDGEGNIYSSWQMQFGKYGGMRGWYRPRREPDGNVKTASLSSMEQENVKFLRSYLKKLREELPAEYRGRPVHDPGVE